MTLDQFEAFSAAGQVAELERLKAGAYLISSSLGKNLTSYLNSIESRIGLIRRGSELDDEAVIEAQLDTLLGKQIGPLSDAGLRNIGIDVR